MCRHTDKGRAGTRPAACVSARAAGYPHARHEGPVAGRHGPTQHRSHGIGSGFILSRSGYILADARLVEAVSEATVVLADRRQFKAKVIGRHSQSDIALLKIVARAACIAHRRPDEADARATGRRSYVSFTPGQPLRSIRAHRRRDNSAQFRRGAVQSRR